MTATAGNIVRVHYTGRLDDGTVFDSSEGREPIEFTLGSERVIPGLSAAVTGMEVGEEKRVTIPSADAYGPRDDGMMVTVSRADLPADQDLEVGQQLEMATPDGKSFNVVVVGVDPGNVRLDANHPLAGLDLTFDLRLVSVAP